MWTGLEVKLSGKSTCHTCMPNAPGWCPSIAKKKIDTCAISHGPHDWVTVIQITPFHR